MGHHPIQTGKLAGTRLVQDFNAKSQGRKEKRQDEQDLQDKISGVLAIHFRIPFILTISFNETMGASQGRVAQIPDRETARLAAATHG